MSDWEEELSPGQAAAPSSPDVRLEVVLVSSNEKEMPLVGAGTPIMVPVLENLRDEESIAARTVRTLVSAVPELKVRS